MTKKELQQKLQLASVKHQAWCQQDGFKGPLRDTREEAYWDAKAYRDIPGNHNKIIVVVDIQTHNINFL